MGYYKSIKKQLPPVKSLTKEELENIIRDISDDNDCFENMVFEYGVRKFIKRYRSEQGNDEFVENPLLAMIRVIDYCKSSYDTSLDCCGEDDEINTIPAKKALEDAKKVLAYLEITLKV